MFTLMYGLNSTGRGELAIGPKDQRRPFILIPSECYILRFFATWHRDIEVFRDELLGSGAAGLVYKGQYRGQNVAIKVGGM